MTQASDTPEVVKILQSLQADIQEIKLNQVSAEEQIKAIDQRIGDFDKSLNKRIDSLEVRGNAQETRFWGMVALLTTALLGIVGKMVFFPGGQV
jgi:hypothetical protein